MPTAKEKQRLRAEKAAALLKEKERRERRRQILTTFGVLALVIVLVGGGFLINSMRDDSGEVSSVPAVGSEHGLTIGEASAPHQVIVYEDFLCPFCGAFEAAGHEELEQLAADGKVQVEYRPYNLLSDIGPYSALAAGAWSQVLANDGGEVALAFHDALFAAQPSEAGPFPDEADLVAMAGEAGADTEALQAALDEGAGEDWVEAATEAARDAGIRGTPTVLLDGEVMTDYRTPEDLAANLVEAVQ